jgi:hypothetical protein
MSNPTFSDGEQDKSKSKSTHSPPGALTDEGIAKLLNRLFAKACTYCAKNWPMDDGHDGVYRKGRYHQQESQYTPGFFGGGFVECKAADERELLTAALQRPLAQSPTAPSDEDWNRALQCAAEVLESYAQHNGLKTRTERYVALNDALQHAVGILQMSEKPVQSGAAPGAEAEFVEELEANIALFRHIHDRLDRPEYETLRLTINSAIREVKATITATLRQSPPVQPSQGVPVTEKVKAVIKVWQEAPMGVSFGRYMETALQELHAAQIEADAALEAALSVQEG